MATQLPSPSREERRRGTISRILYPAPPPRGRRRAATIPLAPPSLAGSSNLPGGFGRAALERLPIRSCSVRGLACHPPCGGRGALLPHLFTLTPRPADGSTRLEAVCFLCHFPSGRPDRGLPGALPSGVRTFLPTRCPEGHRVRRSPVPLRRVSRRLFDPFFDAGLATRDAGPPTSAARQPSPLRSCLRCRPSDLRCPALRRPVIRPRPAKSRNAPASCRDCCAACLSPPRSSRCSRRARAACR